MLDTIVIEKAVTYELQRKDTEGVWRKQAPFTYPELMAPFNTSDGLEMRRRKRIFKAKYPDQEYRLIRNVVVTSVIE